MDMSSKNAPQSADADEKKRPSHAARVLGVGLVLTVVALPVLFSGGFEPWTSIPTTNPFAAPTGIRIVSGTPADPHGVQIDSPVLFRPGGQNQTRLDACPWATATLSIPNVLEVDLTSGAVVEGSVATALNGYCCFSENAYAPDGETLNFTGTAPGGLLMLIEVSPGGTVTTSRIDPSSTNDFTGDLEATRRGLLTLTSSTDDNTTVVYSNTYTEPVAWTEALTRTSDDVFQNRHPGLAVDPEAGDGYLVYPQGTDLILLKFDAEQGAVVWEAVGIVGLGPPPDAVFNYFQVVEDEGNVAVLAPRDNDTVIWFTDDAGGPNPPSFTRTITLQGAPSGDHQAFLLADRQVTFVRPDPDGTGIEIHYVDFSSSLTISNNVKIVEDNSITGAWHNTPPSYAVFLTDTGRSSSAEVFEIRPNAIYIVQGDPDSNVVRYGTVPLILFFDGFESAGTTFWNNSVP
jgi:hypothetical protein